MMGTQPGFRQYVRAVRKRWWLVLLLIVIAASGAYYRYTETPQTYGAVATLFVTASPFATQPAAPGAPDPLGQRQPDLMSDIQRMVAGRAIASRVASELKIPVAQVQRSVSTTIPRGSSMLRIEASAGDPKLAVAMANTTAATLTGYFREINSQDARTARQFIEERLVEVRSRLEPVDRAIINARRDPTGIEGGTGAIVSEYFTTVRALGDARIMRRESEARLTSVRTRLQREEPTMVSERAILDNPVFRQYQARLIALELEKAQLEQIFTSQHPRMQEMEGQIAQVRALIAAESSTQVGREVRTANPVHSRLLQDTITLEIEQNALNARIAALEQVALSWRAAVVNAPTTEGRLARLVREQSILEGNYRLLASSLQEAILRENVARFLPAGMQVMEHAVAAAQPRPTGVPRTAAAAGLAGLVLGIVATIFLEASDTGIRSAEDAERALGVPVLAAVPNANEPRIAHANALFAGFFIILFSLSLLGAYVPTRFTAVNFAGRAMRALVIQPAQPGVEQAARSMRNLWSQSVVAAPR